MLKIKEIGIYCNQKLPKQATGSLFQYEMSLNGGRVSNMK